MNILTELIHEIDLKQYDVFVLFIMSHGTNGEILGKDAKPVKIDDIVEKFDGKNCEGLRDKPKLFFFQACQGGYYFTHLFAWQSWRLLDLISNAVKVYCRNSH
jgi:hypothetical protein